MNTFLNMFPVVVLALMLGAFLALLPVAIIFNARAGMKYRTALAGKIHGLRLGKMLAALGINIDEYLATQRVIDIHQHIKRCEECANLEQCDEGLANGNIEAGSIHFCSNEQPLQEIVNKTDGSDLSSS